ncbi:methylated-DNA--[protein]-cysteine S-methyltransferase [Streptodolium elevatio]|uniref:Methylated-DNA--protein-cysteine methyltransferase n=1 Tax=Streptodolium elevatio TaxID=3157996 RepID=A0ABV3DTU5_9ACTN
MSTATATVTDTVTETATGAVTAGAATALVQDALPMTVDGGGDRAWDPMEFVPPLDGPPRHTVVGSPVGELLLVGDGEALSGLFMLPDAKYVPEIGGDWVRDDAVFDEVTRQLEEYFGGERREFDLRLAPRGTDFQRRVWRELTTIPYGRTTSYGAMADALGSPTASRAVGAANGRNPISIIVPCHRVIASTGALTGYAGGLDKKQQLLALERGSRAA